MPVTIDTSTVSTATAYSNQRKIDRCQNGVLWATFFNSTGGDWEFWYSEDDGTTFVQDTAGGVIDGQFSEGSLFIDLDDYAHFVYVHNSPSSRSILYRRGTPNTARTSWTWGAIQTISNSTVARTPDVVAFRDPSGGGGWFVHIVWSAGNGIVDHSGRSIAADGTMGGLPKTTIDNLAVTSWDAQVSIDFYHTGDGKTVAGGTPHLFVAYSGNSASSAQGVRFSKGSYSAGTWSFATPVVISSGHYVDSALAWLNCAFDGTRVIIGGTLYTGSATKLTLWDLDADDTTTTNHVDTQLVAATNMLTGSLTYDSAGNVYFFGQAQDNSNGTRTLHYRKWTRSGASLGSLVSFDTTGRDSPYILAKRGYSNNRVEWIYTDGSASPYSVTYDSLIVGSSPTVTLSTPADGSSTDLSTGPTFTWTVSDADSETQGSYALRRRLQGTTDYEYWNDTTKFWQATITYNTSTTSSVTFPAEMWQGGSIYDWSVSVKDTGGATSDFPADFTVTNSAARSGVRTKVGSFTKPGVTGTQPITALGFRPKAIIFWTSGSAEASGVWEGGAGSGIFQTIGLTTGSNSSYAVAGASADGQATSSSSHRRMAAKAVTLVDYLGGNINEADLDSFDADGFTLNWTAVTTGIGSPVIMYMAIGGDDITSAKAINWTAAASTGDKSVTGVGFKPDLVFHGFDDISTALPRSATGMAVGFGAMNKHGQQWSQGILSVHGVSTTDTQRVQQTDAAMVLTSNALAVTREAHYVSMDSDGFTLNWSTSGGTNQIISLCLKGVSSKLGAFAKTTAAAPVNQDVARIGFTPKAALFTSKMAAVNGSPEIQSVFGMGASDGANERAAVQWDSDALSTTNAKSMFMNNRAFVHNNTVSQPADGQANANALFSADTITMSWQKNNAEASEVLYLALGDSGASTTPAFVASSTATTATAYSNQRKVDRCQNGVLWMGFWNGQSSTTHALEFWYSTDDGATWTEDTVGRLGFAGTGTTHIPNSSFFIDLDDFAHLVYRDRHNGYIYYRRGTPNAARTVWTWSAATALTATTVINYPDVVACRTPGSDPVTWDVFVVASRNNGVAGNVVYERLRIANDGSISTSIDGLAASEGMGQLSNFYDIGNVHWYPSIDFNHTGDGKTAAGGTPHLYVGWSAGSATNGIRFKKAAYSGGVWTWGDERTIDSTRYVYDASYWLNCLFDGSRVIMTGQVFDGAWADLMLYERDAGDTATETTILQELSGSSNYPSYMYYGSATYDGEGNIYLFGRSNDSPSRFNYRKWTRTTTTLGSLVTLETDSSAPWVSTKRGCSNNLIEWIYTAGNNNPYSVKYGNLNISSSSALNGRWGSVWI